MSQRAVRATKGRNGMGKKTTGKKRAGDPVRRAAGQARESAFMASVVNAFAGVIVGLPAGLGVLRATSGLGGKAIFPGATPLAYAGTAVGLLLVICAAIGFSRNSARKAPSVKALGLATGVATLTALGGAGLAFIIWTSAVSAILLGGFAKFALTMAITGVPAAAAFVSWRAMRAAKQVPPEAYETK